MVPLKSIGVLLQHKWKGCYPQQSGCYLNVSHYIITGMGSFTIWLQPKTPSSFDDYASLMNECKRDYSVESQQKRQEAFFSLDAPMYTYCLVGCDPCCQLEEDGVSESQGLIWSYCFPFPYIVTLKQRKPILASKRD